MSNRFPRTTALSAPQHPLPLWIAAVLAVAAGPVMDAGFPDRDWWPLTLVGIGMYLVAFRGRSVRSSLLLGIAGGLAFYLTHIQWASLFLGLVPMAALSTLESLFFGAGAVAITLATRWVPRVWPTRLGALVLLPVVVGGLWTAREAWASVWPYGGFAWGRVALSQSEGPLAPLFGWLGISGVGFVMVAFVTTVLELGRLANDVELGRVARAVVAVGLASIILVVPAWPTPTDGTMTVLAVQSNSRAGYFDQRTRGDLLRSSLDATGPFIADGAEADVVVWPEGGSDSSPLDNPQTARSFDAVSEAFDAPFVSWAVTERDGRFYNSSILWKAGEGAVDIYDKKHPVPFGEYVPDRAFWRPFAPDLIDLVGREYTPGTTDAVFDLGNGVLAGINICFDVTDDQLMTEAVEQGAQLIFAQSNNADFGRTDESVQQLAIARIRAIELGRTVVNISTVGTSAIVGPDGRTIEQLEWFTTGGMLTEVPLSSAVTPAVLLGRQIEWAVSIFSLGVLLTAAGLSRQRGARG